MATLPPTRSIEDRLLVIETKLEYLATKAELTEAIGKLRDDLTWRLLGIVSLAILVVGLLDKFVRP